MNKEAIIDPHPTLSLTSKPGQTSTTSFTFQRGANFTWSNGRRGRLHVQIRLDKTICNQEWLNACNVVTCSTLTKLRSDHFPIMLEFKNQDLHFVSQFKFLKMWVAHANCVNVVRNSWNTSIVGCPMFIFSEKLKLLKAALKQWNIDTFGNVNNQVKSAKEKLDQIQSVSSRFSGVKSLIGFEPFDH